MSDKYRVDIYARRKAHPAHGGNEMNKVTGTLLDITKVAVVGSVAMGLAGAIAKK